MSNVYYHPEAFGLEVIGSIDDAGSYEFNTLVAWRHKETGEVYYAEDSGCSCPEPFDGFDSIASLTKVEKGVSFDSFESRVHDWKVDASERLELIGKVREYLENPKPRTEGGKK